MDRATRMITGVVVLGAVMSILDTTIVNVALEALSHEFGVQVTTVQWVVTGYLLALAIVIPLAGWASERFGAKRVWMVSVALFLAGSMLAGTAWSIGSLIAFRVLQGLGGGMIMPVGMAILARAAGPGRMGRAMGGIGIAMLLGPVLGPVLGGLLVEHGGWRWIFYVNVPIGVLALALAARLLPHDEPRTCDRLDRTGFLLLSPGLALLVYGLAETASQAQLDDIGSVGPLLAGAGLIVGFVLHARRTPRPLIDLRLFSNRAFSAAAATTACLGAGLFGAMFLLPLYYQVARGESALAAGLLMAPQGIGAAISMPIAGRLTDRLGPGRVVLVGVTVVLLGTLPLTQVTDSTPDALLAAALVVRGLGMGASMMPAMAGAYATLDREGIARATSTLNTVQRVGGSVGTAVLAVVLDRGLPGDPNVPVDQAGMPVAVAGAFAHAFWWALALSAVALVPAALLPRRIAASRPAVPLTPELRPPPRHTPSATAHPAPGEA